MSRWRIVWVEARTPDDATGGWTWVRKTDLYPFGLAIVPGESLESARRRAARHLERRVDDVRLVELGS